MNDLKTVEIQETKESSASMLQNNFKRLDERDIIILVKFYFTGQSFPDDTQPYCFPILVDELQTSGMRIGLEAIRKRVDRLAKSGFLIKIRDCNPKNFLPLKDSAHIELIRELIKKRMSKTGIDQIFKA